MGQTISFPFRVQPNGQIAVVDRDSDSGIAEALAALVLTRLGEREMAPGFGIIDPTFGDITLPGVNAGVELYGPPVRATQVLANRRRANVADVVVEWQS